MTVAITRSVHVEETDLKYVTCFKILSKMKLFMNCLRFQFLRDMLKSTISINLSHDLLQVFKTVLILIRTHTSTLHFALANVT